MCIFLFCKPKVKEITECYIFFSVKITIPTPLSETGNYSHRPVSFQSYSFGCPVT